MPITIAQLAREAAGYFETRTRDSGESYDVTRDDAPEWVGDLVRDAHGEMLPDDWRYATIRAALSHIDDCDYEDRDDAHDGAAEFADGNVDTYNADRAAWLGSHSARIGYCDDAAAEYGDDQGAGDVMAAIALGQYAESSEVYGLVVESLSDRLDALGDDDDDDGLTPVPGARPTYDDDGRERIVVATCGVCGRSWNDAAASQWTPAPSGRCPFEYEHEGDDARDDR